MQSKISLKRLTFIAGITIVLSAVVVLFLSFVLSSHGYYKKPVLFMGQSAQNSNQPELPVRLKIPKINVDANILSVGLTPQGAMAVPEGPADAAWYNLGPRPGENGSAVIDGHEGWKNGIPAVFDNLNKLQKGDKIYVQDEKGATITFVVRALRMYGKNQDASDVFGSTDGKAHLNLITCAGIWDKISKSSSKRLIVFADKEL